MSKTIQFRTASGSIYELEGDKKGGTWKRLEHSPESNEVRTASGPYSRHSPIRVGSSVVITGPSLVLGRDYREITTSPVIQIIEGDGIEEIKDGEEHTSGGSSSSLPEASS